MIPDCSTLTRDEKAALIIQLAAMLVTNDASASGPVAAEGPETALTPEEVAARLGVSRRSVIRQRHRAPYREWLVTTGSARTIRFSARRLEAYIASGATPLPPRPRRLILAKP